MKHRDFMDLTDEEVTRIMTDIILKNFSSAKVDAIDRNYDREEISVIVTTGGWKVGEGKTREFSDEITIWMPTGPDSGISAPFSPQTKEEIEELKTEYHQFLFAALYRDFIKDNPYVKYEEQQNPKETYTDFTITERTEPFTLQEVLDFIDETNISKQDACELKARIVDLLQAERERTVAEREQSYGEEVPELD